MNILLEIATQKRLETEALKKVQSLNTVMLEAIVDKYRRQTVSMRQSILSSSGIIAEFKRRSPSKGEIAPMARVSDVIPGYAEAGAAACSVLTDTTFFSGALTDLAVARSLTDIPLLRKDFIVDEYQIYQARTFGADAILLIAAILTEHEIEKFTTLAHKLGLEVLLEIHSENEISKIHPEADMIGVNNRDLTTFSTDLSASQSLIEALPSDKVKVAESGISSPDEIAALRQAGFSGFLIGEAFMKQPEPAKELSRFIAQSQNED